MSKLILTLVGGWDYGPCLQIRDVCWDISPAACIPQNCTDCCTVGWFSCRPPGSPAPPTIRNTTAVTKVDVPIRAYIGQFHAHYPVCTAPFCWPFTTLLEHLAECFNKYFGRQCMKDNIIIFRLKE
jgi:hypothetical protein